MLHGRPTLVGLRSFCCLEPNRCQDEGRDARLERLHAELVQCAQKTSVELFNQEHLAAESQLRAQSDETRGKTAAHDMMLQAMENRVESMEKQRRPRRPSARRRRRPLPARL